MKKYFHLKYFLILLLLVQILIFNASCSKNINKESNKISIAEQYGISYAPVEIMKQNKYLEKNMAGIEVNWQQLSNTSAIREAMLSNRTDVGFMAIPPFLIGWDKGMEWKIASGVSFSSVGLVTYKENIKSIKDFNKNDRIALPQPGSIQHILLAMASEKELGDPHKFDNIFVTMSHPDGMNALLAKKDITAHFTAPPYLTKEMQDKSIHEILNGKDIMGEDFSFVVAVTTNKFHDNNKKTYDAFVKSLNEAIDFINKNPEKAAEILAPVYNLSKEETLKYITNKENLYTSKVKGLDKFYQFMIKNNFITRSYKNTNDIIWEDVNNEK